MRGAARSVRSARHASAGAVGTARAAGVRPRHALLAAALCALALGGLLELTEGPGGETLRAPVRRGVRADESRARPPTVVTGEVARLTAHTAALTATVDPHGRAISECWFVIQQAAGADFDIEPCDSLPRAAHAPVTVAAKVAGLRAGATYYFYAIAVDAASERASGREAAFATPPA
jgi:hypothetical protein